MVKRKGYGHVPHCASFFSFYKDLGTWLKNWLKGKQNNCLFKKRGITGSLIGDLAAKEARTQRWPPNKKLNVTGAFCNYWQITACWLPPKTDMSRQIKRETKTMYCKNTRAGFLSSFIRIGMYLTVRYILLAIISCQFLKVTSWQSRFELLILPKCQNQRQISSGINPLYNDDGLSILSDTEREQRDSRSTHYSH